MYTNIIVVLCVYITGIVAKCVKIRVLLWSFSKDHVSYRCVFTIPVFLCFIYSTGVGVFLVYITDIVVLFVCKVPVLL